MKKEERIKHYFLEEVLKPDNSGSGYICPLCDSGTGPHGTGITSQDNNEHFTCWKGCYTNADAIDILSKLNNIEDLPYNEKIKNILNQIGLEPETKPEKNHHDYILEANRNLQLANYYRGISLDTLNRFKVGYDPNYYQDNQNAPRLIIPTNDYSYLARAINDNTPTPKAKKGKSYIFNMVSLKDSTSPVFIVEGELDAMSIIDIGYNAIALRGLTNTKQFFSELNNINFKGRFIISLDNEESKNINNTISELQRGLKALNIINGVNCISKPYKDANELLIANRELLKNNCLKAISGLNEEVLEEYQQQSVYYNLDKFFKEIQDTTKNKPIATGFSNLDHYLDGGFYKGLYIVGAVTSLGKTTFTLQVVDQIAKSGKDVIIFSLENPASEVIAKSISRESNRNGLLKSLTTRDIITGGGTNKQKQESIYKASQIYKEYCKHIFIIEGNSNITVNDVTRAVEKHVKITNTTPVILIDYLQLLRPLNERLNDKMNTDYNVAELKNLVKKYCIPVIAISSFNRTSYTDPVDLTSFKESGAIEYSSDILIGLQFKGMDYNDNDKSERERRIRVGHLRENQKLIGYNGGTQEIQLKVLKNRNGITGSCFYDFIPKFSDFTPVEPEEEKELTESVDRITEQAKKKLKDKKNGKIF